MNDSFAAMDETIRAKKPNVAGIILRSRMAKLAAVAVIIAAVGLLMVYKGPRGQDANQKVLKVPKSPTDMLTARSLMIAYRHGGIEEIERQCDKALEIPGPRLDTLNMKELFTEIEVDLERMEL